MILEGALAFFVFSEKGEATCHVLSSSDSIRGVGGIRHGGGQGGAAAASNRVIIVEKNEWHAMTAAPPELGKLCIHPYYSKTSV